VTTIVSFDYLKEGTTTHREILPLGQSFIEYVEGLELSKAGEDKEKILKLVREFNESLEPYVKKYFRRFLASGISNSSSAPITKATK